MSSTWSRNSPWSPSFRRITFSYRRILRPGEKLERWLILEELEGEASPTGAKYVTSYPPAGRQEYFIVSEIMGKSGFVPEKGTKLEWVEAMFPRLTPEGQSYILGMEEGILAAQDPDVGSTPGEFAKEQETK